MSARTVSKAHIDVLVNALIDEGVIGESVAQTAGEKLWSENYRSVNARYGERNRRPPYRFGRIGQPLDEAVVLRSIACWEYQTCEYQRWEYQKGAQLLRRLREVLIERLEIEPVVDDYGRTSDGTHYWCDVVSRAQGVHLPWGIYHIREALKEGATA